MNNNFATMQDDSKSCIEDNNLCTSKIANMTAPSSDKTLMGTNVEVQSLSITELCLIFKAINNTGFYAAPQSALFNDVPSACARGTCALTRRQRVTPQPKNLMRVNFSRQKKNIINEKSIAHQKKYEKDCQFSQQIKKSSSSETLADSLYTLCKPHVYLSIKNISFISSLKRKMPKKILVGIETNPGPSMILFSNVESESIIAFSEVVYELSSLDYVQVYQTSEQYETLVCNHVWMQQRCRYHLSPDAFYSLLNDTLHDDGPITESLKMAVVLKGLNPLASRFRFLNNSYGYDLLQKVVCQYRNAFHLRLSATEFLQQVRVWCFIFDRDEACDLDFDNELAIVENDELIAHMDMMDDVFDEMEEFIFPLINNSVPAPRLVGIEPNPGPDDILKPNINHLRRFKQANSCKQLVVTPKMKSIALNKARNIKMQKLLAQFQIPFISPQIDISDRVEDKLDDFMEMISNLSDKFDVERLLKSVTEFASIDKNKLSYAFMLFPVYLIVCQTAVSCPKSYLSGMTIAAILAFLSAKTPADLWSVISPHVSSLLRQKENNPDKMKAQLGTDTFSDLSTILMMVTGYNILGSVPDGSKLAKCISVLSDFGKKKEGFDTSILTIVSLVEKVINFFRTEVLGYDRVKFMEESNVEVAKWITQIEKLCNEVHDGTLLINTESAERVFALSMEGNKLMSRYGSMKDSGRIKNSILTYMNTLKKIQIPFDRANITGNGVRMPPVCLLFRGPSGVGKSTITVPFLAEYLAKTLPTKELKNFQNNIMDSIYCRQPEHVYWDGYRGQAACVFDDFGQCKDIAGTPDNEFMNLIRCGNLFPNMLHCADMESKGMNNFRSNVILCTSNLRSMYPNSIIEAEAVQRRFDFVFDVLPKLEFCIDPQEMCLWSRRLDKNKVNGLTVDIYEFHAFSFSKNEYIGVYSYSEAMKLVIELNEKRTAFADNYNVDLSKIVNEAVASRIRAQGKFDSLDSFKKNVSIEKFPSLDEICSTMGYCFTYLQALFPNIYTDNMTPDELVQAISIMELDDDFNVAYKKGLTLNELNSVKSSFAKSIISYFAELRNGISSFRACLADSLSTFMLNLHPNYIVAMKTIGAMLGVLSIVSVVFNFIVPYLFPKSDMVAEGSYKTRRTNRTRKVNYTPPNVFRQEAPQLNVVRPEGGADNGLDQISQKIIARNFYRVAFVRDSGSKMEIGYCTIIKDRIAMINHHFVTMLAQLVKGTDFNDNSILRISRLSCDVHYDIPFSCILSQKDKAVLKDQDMFMFRLPTNVPVHSDITKYFVNRKMYEGQRDYYTRLIIANEYDVPCYYHSYAQPQNQIVVHLEDKEDSNFLVRKAYHYTAPTKTGDCGGLLMLLDSTSGSRKILGVHCAGNDSRQAVATALCVEDINSLLDLYFPNCVESHFEDMKFAQAPAAPIPGSFTPLYQHDLTVNSPKKNKVVPSDLYNSWRISNYGPSLLIPMVNKEGILVDPRKIALQTYAKNLKYLPQQYLKFCADSYYAFMVRNSDVDFNHKPTVYDFNTAVLGVPGEEFCESIPRKTSAGFPYCVTVGKKSPGKTFFFGNDQDYDLTNINAVQLKERVLFIVSQARKNVRLEHIYTDNLKDEKRKLEKIQLGKTRLFSGCPIDLLIATRMYFLDFSMYIMRNRISNGNAIGVNVYSHEWDKLANKLKTKGPSVVAGDFAGYDGSLNPQILNLILDIINRWYGDVEDNRVRSVLWNEVVNSKHISGNLVYEWTHSLPSGHPLTTIINSLYDHIVFRFAYLGAHKFSITSLNHFDDNCYVIAYGDDNILNISEDKILIFNQNTIPGYLSELGLTYTDELKLGGVIPNARKLEEVSFLKRMFRYDDILCRYVAPLSLDTILEMPYWTKEGPERQSITRSNVEKACEELSLHTEEVFDQWFDVIVKASEKNLKFVPQLNDKYALLLKCITDDCYY